MSIRITQGRADLALKSQPSVSVTVAYANKLGQSNPQRVVSNVAAQTLCKVKVSDDTKMSQVYGQVMVSFTPNFEWIEMFINEVFPYDISFNSIGATRFATDVIVVDSGHDQRTSRWDQPLMEYDVAYGVRTMEHLHGLIAFFRAMKGRRHAFLYHDVMDHTSTLAVQTEARRAPPISPTDQVLGIGDDLTKQFQLVKRYPTPGAAAEPAVRPIYKPKPGTVSIAINGVVVNNYDLDTTTGKVTFKPRLSLLNLQNVNLTNVATNRWRITVAAQTFSGFIVGEKIITNGWVNPRNNTNETIELRITSKAADGSWIEYTTPSSYGAVETNVSGVNVYVHPAPRTGVTITAGFEFFVPVRFDTDRLPVSLEEYGIGGAADVKLIEVRPHEEDA